MASRKCSFPCSSAWKLLVDREVGKLSLGRNLERVSHLDDEIWRSPGRMGPAVFENRQFGHQRRITFGSTAINPRDDGLDLLWSQTPIIAERAEPSIRTPRRHLPLGNFVLDGPRPGTHLFVRHQRHWRYLAGPMARHAVVEQNRRDVLVERGRWVVGSGGHAHACSRHNGQKRPPKTNGADFMLGSFVSYGCIGPNPNADPPGGKEFLGDLATERPSFYPMAN